MQAPLPDHVAPEPTADAATSSSEMTANQLKRDKDAYRFSTLCATVSASIHLYTSSFFMSLRLTVVDTETTPMQHTKTSGAAAACPFTRPPPSKAALVVNTTILALAIPRASSSSTT